MGYLDTIIRMLESKNFFTMFYFMKRGLIRQHSFIAPTNPLLCVEASASCKKILQRRL